MPKICIAGALVIYSTYTLDRALGCEEDKINRRELGSSRKGIALFVCLLSFLTGVLLLSGEGLFLIGFLPIAVGYTYSRGVRVGNYFLKLKGNLGGKNITVALTWGAFIAGIVRNWASNWLLVLLVFSFFGIKSFINTVIYDFRDLEGDAMAGLKTLPLYLGEARTRRFLMLTHNSLHIVVVAVLNAIGFEPVIVIGLWFCGFIYIHYYSKYRENEDKIKTIMRDVLVDGEFILAVGTKAAIDSLLHLPSPNSS